MTIYRADAPKGWADLVAHQASVMRRSFSPKLNADDSGGGGTITEIHDPFPVYYLPPEHLSVLASPSDAQQVGWRYLMTDGDALSSVDVKNDEGCPRVAVISRGGSAAALSAAQEAAKRQTGSQAYEVRILEFGRAGPGALWLHSDNVPDRFFALDSQQPKELTKNEVLFVAARKADLLSRAYSGLSEEGGASAAHALHKTEIDDDLGG
jgi:hypothetical protein